MEVKRLVSVSVAYPAVGCGGTGVDVICCAGRFCGTHIRGVTHVKAVNKRAVRTYPEMAYPAVCGVGEVINGYCLVIGVH